LFLFLQDHWGFEPQRSCKNAKAKALRKKSGAGMRRGARRRPVSPKQDVEGWKANPPCSVNGVKYRINSLIGIVFIFSGSLGIRTVALL
jgi:hypothetical protein